MSYIQKTRTLLFRHRIVLFVGVAVFLTGCPGQTSRDKIDQEQGELLEKAGALSQQDYVKTRKLMDGAERAPITEKDLTWACSLLQGKRVTDKGGPQRFISVASVMVRNDGPAPTSLRPQYLTIGIEMVRYEDKRSSVVELGIIVLAKSREKTAGNLVRPFLNTSDLRETAGKALKVLE